MAEYVRVAQANEIETHRSKLVEVQGKKIALFNVDGKFYAIDNTCTHRGGPLWKGELNGDEVTCPLARSQIQGHQWRGAQVARAARGELLQSPGEWSGH